MGVSLGVNGAKTRTHVISLEFEVHSQRMRFPSCTTELSYFIPGEPEESSHI